MTTHGEPELMSINESATEQPEEQASQNYWDEFYSSDEYKFLESPAEIGRFGVIAEIICLLPNRPKVLDIGCGLGHLCRLIPDNRIQSYLGIDTSHEAIVKARQNYPQHEFLCINAEDFTTDAVLDAVVISCILEILERDGYRRVIEKALALLSPNGILILSIYSSPSGDEVMRHLQAEKLIQKHIEIISHDSDLTWHILTIPKSEQSHSE